MLATLGMGWIVMAVAVVAILSFILGMALNNLMGGDGFGPIGNMVVITGGFFLSIYCANLYGYHFRDLKLGVGTGIIGGFAIFGVLALLKARIIRN